MKNFLFKSIFLILTLLICGLSTAGAKASPTTAPNAKYVVVFVWDGLRPDAVNQKDTPNLYELMQKGTQFLDNHASYPSFTMMNAASFATGDRAGKTGFFGNTLWQPTATGNDAQGNVVDFNQPVFTEDYKILQALNKDKLFYVNTLFEEAHKKQLFTAAFGKSGPAFMQDYLALDKTLDERHVHPLNFAKNLQKDGYALPKDSTLNFESNQLILSADNGSPTEFEKIHYLKDGVTPDPTDNHGSPYNRSNRYMVKIFLDQIIKKEMPQLSVIWLRNPDSTEHTYGPGTFNYYDALHSNDEMLGTLLAEIKNKKINNQTDIFIVSDHAHSTVSGPINKFPLRNIKDQQVGDIDAHGYSVSGEMRAADLLSAAGFHAYDGRGCFYNPVLSGIKSDKSALYPDQRDETGLECGKIGEKYTTKAYKVPSGKLPSDAVIIAANGGTDYFYIPSHNKTVVENLIKFFASHKQFDAIFVDDARYGKLPGTLPMSTIGILNPQGRNPDVVVGFSYNEKVKVNDLPGIEYSDERNLRGMHGSFSPIDVHNFMMAFGPDFRTGFKDSLPSGNVDVAPTVAHILGLSFPDTDGRVLTEALMDSSDPSYKIDTVTYRSEKALTGLVIFDELNALSTETRFHTLVQAKILRQGDRQYYYFDLGKAIREGALR